jgi:hypothetical protein
MNDRTPTPIRPTPPPDAGRWLVLALIDLAKRFLGMAVAAGFTEAERRVECPKCRNVWKG